MSRVIRLDTDVYEALQKMARPFEDTPNSVIRRLLEHRGHLQVERLRQPEPANDASGGGRRQAGRTPQEAFRRPILEALIDLGGRGRASDVLDRVEQKMKARLTPIDRSTVKTGPARWQVYARWERQNMVHAGLLAGPHGVWEITERGRAGLNQTA